MSTTTTGGHGLAPHCGICDKTENLLRCARCKVMLYCSQDHQVTDYPAHKYACSNIGRKKKALDTEEETLRNTPGDIFTPADPFNTAVGHFWGMMGTRDYMRARIGFVHAFRNVNTYDSVKTQLEHLMDMLRLCRSDNLGVRDMVPGVMLRLGMDQECYDFIKWYNTTGNEGDYDWGNMDLPFLDVKNADVFEPVDYLNERFGGTSQIVGVMLVKIRLLLDLTALQDAAATGKAVSPTQLRSSIIANSRAIIERKDHRDIISKLKGQVDVLYQNIDKGNKYFWPALLEPGDNLDVLPGMYSMGTPEEMQLILERSYSSWVETPGAIDVIRART
ncbi:hypothetical protein ASPWEDRAFT_22769 [Aspergillus wentii DTO 134E9]|uniref:MYND-type domain-containing protein n=1 Tax=Aspergillus wentii DTO 134E9 TaxID=1073089 RepID=A0A1L9S0A5_ASPWE|nr:uncharacterized protein ASPWEDRAFT_22769 [Aspergillus wentii DTO 134E9]KAI9933021.1 hypothetical protein MW887_009275 [Aspergillus wentii]OJJ40605.1 hypothetical protein ASPWEDRAFT_22769 [Aspergillus wentii DTO 134E9]